MKIKVASLALTLVLLALIIASAPTMGVNISISNLAGSYTKGQKIDFLTLIEISTPEHLPIQYINLTFIFPDSSIQICQIYLNKTVKGCSFLTINDIDFDSLSYSYGYGYGYDNGNLYSLGYGYGYSGNGKITVNFTIDSSVLQIGSYKLKADVYAGLEPNTHTFSSNYVSFNIIATATTTTVYLSRGGIMPRYSLQILSSPESVTQSAGSKITYFVTVRNNGNVDLEKVYLTIPNLPEDAFFESETIALKVNETRNIRFTLSVDNPAKYLLKLKVIGEIGMRTAIQEKDMDLTVTEEAQKETGKETPETQSQGRPMGITGFIVAAGKAVLQYWYLPLSILALGCGAWLFLRRK